MNERIEAAKRACLAAYTAHINARVATIVASQANDEHRKLFRDASRISGETLRELLRAETSLDDAILVPVEEGEANT